MMISRLIDRPCGVGFLDMTKYTKFITCGVDDARDVLGHDDYMEFGYTTFKPPKTPSIATIEHNMTTNEFNAAPTTNTDSGDSDKNGDDEHTTLMPVAFAVGESSVHHPENPPPQIPSLVIDKSK